MAKDQNKSPLQTIKELEDYLKDSPLDQETRDNLLKQAKSKVYEDARGKMEDAVKKVVSAKQLEDDRTLLAGNRQYFTIEYKEDGEVEVKERFRTGLSGSRTSRSGGSNKVIVNGTEYPSAAKAADAHGLEHKGDSAVRVLERALAAKQIESFEKVDDDEGDSDEG